MSANESKSLPMKNKITLLKIIDTVISPRVCRWRISFVPGIALILASLLSHSALATTVIDEDFVSSASNFSVVSGGSWAVNGGRYELSSPSTAGNGLLGNISVHDTSVSGDQSIGALFHVIGTSNVWNDFALIFNYQDSSNFYYASFNESNDGYTSGVFKVVSGTPTELADITTVISSDTDYTVVVERTGSSIVVKLNGSQVASVSDSTFSGGKVGFGSKNDSVQYDDLVVDNGSTVAVTGVTVSPTSLNLEASGTSMLTETVIPSNATNQSVTWSSSNSSIATVDSSGLVTGVGSGSATITVTTVDGSFTANCSVNVNISVTGVSVSPTSLNLNIGDSGNLTETIAPSNATNPTVVWTSSNTSVATVNSTGEVVGVGAGNATITVTTVDGSYTANCSVAVSAGSISEDFSSGASNFTEIAGGTWGVSSGRYVLSSPADSGSNGILGNISVHNTLLNGDYTVGAVLRITGTATAWNDTALVFGYQDSNNYYYVSLNESNDGYTKGIFKVVNGSPTELADIGSSIASDTDYPVQVQRSGSSILVLLNGSQVASASDSTFSGGQVGFGSKNDGGQFDDLVVTGPGGLVAAPGFDPGGGTYSSGQSVTITSATSGASIRYTTDGSNPTSSSGTVYAAPVSISATTTLKAIAYKSGMTDSSVTSATYTITGGQVAAPQLSPGAGVYGSTQDVTITTATSGATIRYTTDGSTPSSSSGTVYSSAVSISTTTTLKAIAYKTGMSDSTVTTANYTIDTGGLPPKPGPSNTGVPAGTTLTSYTGSYTITTDGTVIDSKIMTSRLHIKANNVTIRKCRWDSGGPYSIQCTYGYTGLLVEDCELRNMGSAGIYGSNFTARRLNIHDSDGDGLKPSANCLVESCWIHHLGKGDGAHADGVQTHGGGGSNFTYRYNNFDMPVTDPAPYKSNAAFMLEPDGGELHNVLIEYNWMNGGNYTVYGSNMSGVTVRYNYFGRDYRHGIKSKVVNWYGNVWEDNGQPAP